MLGQFRHDIPWLRDGISLLVFGERRTITPIKPVTKDYGPGIVDSGYPPKLSIFCDDEWYRLFLEISVDGHLTSTLAHQMIGLSPRFESLIGDLPICERSQRLIDDAKEYFRRKGYDRDCDMESLQGEWGSSSDYSITEDELKD